MKDLEQERNMVTIRMLHCATRLFEMGFSLDEIQEVIKLEYERLNGVNENG